MTEKTPFITDMVKEFYLAAGEPVHDSPHYLSEERRLLRMKMMFEEMNELCLAMRNEDIVEVADAIADIIYVTAGTAIEYGLGSALESVLAEVHRSNMAKRFEDGLFHRRHDGKIMKPPDWSPPNIEAML